MQLVPHPTPAVVFAVFVIGGLLGSIAHELAHWLVWRATGRRPRLYLWELIVRPRSGPTRALPGDRVAAVAPYVVGSSVAVAGYLSGLWPLVVFGLAMHGIPSAADVRVISGKATFDLDSQGISS